MKRTIILLTTVLTMITLACNHHRRHNQDASIQEISKDETNFEETSSKKSYTNEEKRKAKESLALQAEIANKQYAREMIDKMTIILGVDFDGDNLIYLCGIDEDYATIEQLRTEAQKETLEKTFRNYITNAPEFAVIKEYLTKINGKILLIFIGDNTNKVFTITIDFK